MRKQTEERMERLNKLSKSELIEMLLQKEFDYREMQRLYFKSLGYKVVEEDNE